MSVEAAASPSADRRRKLAWSLFALISALFAAGILLGVLTADFAADEEWGGNEIVLGLLTILGFYAFPTVGMIITSRRPHNRIGWICLAIGFTWGIVGLADGYALYGIRDNPGSLPLPSLALSLSNVAWAPAIVMMGVFLVLLFPDGSPPSKRWRPVLWVAGSTAALIFVLGLFFPGDFSDSGYPDVENPLGVEALKPIEPFAEWLIPLLPLTFLTAATGLVIRYRRSVGTERIQLKWLVTAGMTVALIFSFALVSSLTGLDEHSAVATFLQNIAVLSFGLIPIAIGFAVLKHRLYDINVVINKALVYGAVAIFITIAYVGIVVGIGRAVGSTRNLGLSIVATTVVAVAFQPVRERAQHLANKLVYGKRATPYEVLSEFSGDMAQAVATEELLPNMARIVGEAAGAERADIWLAVGSELVPEATWPADSPAPAIVPILAGDEIVVPSGLAAEAVRHQGEVLGVIAVTAPSGGLDPAEAKLLEDLASQAGLVLRNVRLLEDIKVSRQRLVTAQDEERRRMERDLHDGAQQRLVATALGLKMARNLIKDESDPVAARIDQASEELGLALAELREFARGIHPAILSERGLDAALRSLAERSPVPAEVQSSLEERLPDSVETSAYFAVSEALTNVAKYSQADRVRITASREDGFLTVTVEDDGIGGADPGRGTGLRGLTDRLAVVDGKLDLHSPSGEGTRLRFQIPVAAPVITESR